jgi:hypothetical protein
LEPVRRTDTENQTDSAPEGCRLASTLLRERPRGASARMLSYGETAALAVRCPTRNLDRHNRAKNKWALNSDKSRPHVAGNQSAFFCLPIHPDNRIQVIDGLKFLFSSAQKHPSHQKIRMSRHIPYRWLLFCCSLCPWKSKIQILHEGFVGISVSVRRGPQPDMVSADGIVHTGCRIPSD